MIYHMIYDSYEGSFLLSHVNTSGCHFWLAIVFLWHQWGFFYIMFVIYYADWGGLVELPWWSDNFSMTNKSIYNKEKKKSF